jgi:hypothetical protein
MTLRRWIYAAIGIALLLGNIYAFWPFVEAGREMDRFCDALPAGAALDQVRALAAGQGYEVSVEPGGRVLIEDPRSMGRRSCTLQFGAPPQAAPAASGAASS